VSGGGPGRGGRRFLLLALLAVVLPALAAAPRSEARRRQYFSPVLDPRTYASPSGEWALYVNPGDKSGRGGATYRLRRKGAVVWEGPRPFALWEAGVADDGTVGGVAYSRGFEGWGGRKPDDYGDFSVVVLGPAGEVRLQERTKRTPSRFLHDVPNPLANGVIVDGANDRLVVRVRDPDINRRAEGWWVYRLSTGREVRRFSPKPLLGEPKDGPTRFVIDARAVAGTPLVLAHWWRYDTSGGTRGARFTLHDPEGGDGGAPVWSLELPRDYTVAGDEDAQDRLRDEIGEGFAILRTDAPGRFTLRFVAERRKVTFAVSRDGPGGKWRVTEVGPREPYVAPAAEPPPFAAPEIRPRLRDRITLKAPAAGKPSPIRGVHNLTVAGPGRLAFLRRDGATDLVLVEDRRGRVLHTVPLAKMALKGEDSIDALVWQGGTRFLVFVARRFAKKTSDYFSEAYRVDARTKTVARLVGFRAATSRSAAALPGAGGFLILTYSQGLHAYDAAGRRVWTRSEEAGGDADSVAVLKDGTVAALDASDTAVTFLDPRSGRTRRTLSLNQAWGREANYPSDIVADLQGGGFVVHDFQGTPSVVRMSAAGRVLGGFVPHDTRGGRIEYPDVSVGSDGRLWVSDKHALLRMDARGRPDRPVGQLREVAEFAVSPTGRILAADARTNAVHVFDRSGRWLHACAPADTRDEDPASEFSRQAQPQIAFGPNDSFAVAGQWFDAKGKRRAKPAGFRTPVERVSRLRRRADATWLGFVYAVAVSPGGALAVADTPNDTTAARPSPVRARVSLYDPADAPLRVLPLPAAADDPYPEIAFDGRTLVVSVAKRVYAYLGATGQPLWQFARPAPAQGDPWQPFLTDAGRTLCLFDPYRRTLYRYALP